MIQAADPYHLLQVIPDAEPEVIQAAYRALARKYHPDMGGTDLQMAQLNAAWEKLRDRGGRELYDRERKESAAAQTTPTQHGAVEDPPVQTVVPLRSRSPRGRPGTVLDFGRYAGLSLGDLAFEDPDYLVWLARTPIGHRLSYEIDTLMAARRPTASRSERPKSRFARSR